MCSCIYNDLQKYVYITAKKAQKGRKSQNLLLDIVNSAYIGGCIASAGAAYCF